MKCHASNLVHYDAIGMWTATTQLHKYSIAQINYNHQLHKYFLINCTTFVSSFAQMIF